MRTVGRPHFRNPSPRPRKVGAPGLLIASAVVVGAIALGGCGGGSTTTDPSPGQNAPLGQHKDNPTQEHLAKDNPTQVPVGKDRSVKARLDKDNPSQVPLGQHKDNPTQVPLSAEKGGNGAGS
jgi:hypothetical protein